MSETKWTFDAIAANLGPVDAPLIALGERQVSAVERGYREAASVLSFFSASKLNPTGVVQGQDADDKALNALLADCSLVQDGGHSRWMLHNSARQKTLAQLGDRAAMQAALEANPDRPTDLLQRTLEDHIQSRAKSLAEQTLEELTITVQVVGWLDGILNGLPDPEELSRRIAWEQLLEPFRYLVGDHFRGRAAELDTLHRYVAGITDVSEPSQRISRNSRQPIRARVGYGTGHVRPLLIHGPGGMGKSTLVSKLILETVSVKAAQRIPFAYIDFDRPGMLPEEPITLLIEIVRQLGIQYEHAANVCEQVRREWLERLTYTQEASGYVQTKRVTRSGSRSRGVASKGILSTRGRRTYLSDFEKIIDAIDVPERPFLLVLDTFEEVQYLSQDFVAELWALFDDLKQIIPQLRPVLAGRSTVRQLQTQALLLTNLDDEAARGFLAANGIDDDDLAVRLINQVGGNPLSLRLAVEVIQKEADAGGDLDLDGINTDSRRIADGLIQGQLYRRILGHVHSPEIRKLAHPGLTLRKITPELIRDVLAVACGLGALSPRDAKRLFDELAREVSLVTFDEEGALRHRPDVRRIMLEALRRDEPDKVYEIHMLAVEYYRQRPGPEARAEEIYHLLFTGASDDHVDERWLDGVEPYLRTALEESPSAKQPYLASRLGITSDSFAWDETALDDWERHIETRVDDLMGLGRLNEALSLLAERSERTAGSPLYRLEAQISERLERWPEARRVARDGIYSLRTTHLNDDFDPGMMLDLYLIAANADEHLGHYDQAQELLRVASRLELELDAVDVELLQLDIIMRQLRLCHRDNREDAEEVAQLRTQARVIIDRTMQIGLRSQLQIIVAIIEEFGIDDPELLGQLLELVTFSAYDDPQKAMLAQALYRWDVHLSRGADDPHILARAAGLNIKDQDKAQNLWLNHLLTLRPAEQHKLLLRLMSQFKPSVHLIETIASIMREQMSGAADDRRSDNALTNSIQAALLSAFPERDELRKVVRTGLDEDLDIIAGSGIYVDAMGELISWADEENRLQELLSSAIEARPEQQDLRKVYELLYPILPETGAMPLPSDTSISNDTMNTVLSFGQSSASDAGINVTIGGPAMDRAESAVRLPMEPPPGVIRREKIETFASPELVFNWSLRMREVARCICRIEVKEGFATGFLVGPNLVMTCRDGYRNADTVAPSNIRLRFDYLKTGDGVTVDQGTVYQLADDWLVAENDALNIALLRTDAEPGRDLVPDTGQRRGWLQFALPDAPVINEPVFVMQHRGGGFLTMERLSIAFPPDESDTRLGLYNDSNIGSPGAAGAPCFNTRWEVIAIRESSGNLTDERFEPNCLAIQAIRADKVLDLPVMRAALADTKKSTE